MDIPPVSYNMFREIELSLSQQWEDTLWISIAEAGEEERNIALDKGQIDKDGNVWIVV